MKKPSFIWLVPFVIVWPLLALGLQWLRFGSSFFTDGDTVQLWSGIILYALVGVISGVVAILLMRSAKTSRGKRATLIGYLCAVPFGFVAALLGPLSAEVLYFVPMSDAVVYYVVYPIFGAIAGSLWLGGGAAIGRFSVR